RQHALVMLKPKNVGNIPAFTIDGWVFAFAVAVSLLTGCVFGLLPAIELKAPSRGGTIRESIIVAQTRFASRLRQALIVGELALSLVLLCGAGLLLRSLSRVQGVNPGFNPDGV